MRPPSGAWTLATEGHDAVLVSGSDYLRAEIGRIAAAATVSLRCVGSLAELSEASPQTPILIGSDVGQQPRGRPRQGPLVLVGLAGEGDGLWELAARLPAERVAVLPEAAGWLAEYLSRMGGTAAGGSIMGVLGGCGGAGASTLSCWLAQSAGRRGETLLVDADPSGGGLEVALGAEDVPGIRWPDVDAARGSINPAQLKEALPAIGGFSFLSWPRNSSEGRSESERRRESVATAAVLDAAVHGFDAIIIDLARGRDALAADMGVCDRTLIVAPARLRAIHAARAVIDRCPQQPTAAVIRGPLPPGTDPELLAGYVGVPLGGYWRTTRGCGGAEDGGRLLEHGLRRPIRRLTGRLLDGVGAPGAAVVPAGPGAG